MIVFSDIAKGVFNTIFKSRGVELVSKYRLKICNNCEFSGKRKVRCKLCGCFLTLKSRCISETNSCPIGNWFNIADITDAIYAKDNLQNTIDLLSTKVGRYKSSRIYRNASTRINEGVNESLFSYIQEIQEQILLYKKDGVCLTELEAARIASILVNNIMMNQTLNQ